MKNAVKKPIVEKIVIIFLFLVNVFVLFKDLDLPFVGPNAFCPLVFSQAAKSYNKHGFLATWFLQKVNPFTNINDVNGYYLNHPPLISVLLAFSYKIFGNNDFAARLVPALFSVVSLVVLCQIVGLYYKKAVPFVLAASLFCPMFLFFGKFVSHDALVLTFILLTCFFYLKYEKENKKSYLWLAMAATFFGSLTDWPVVEFALVLAGVIFLVKKDKTVFLIPLASLASVFLYFGIIFFRFGDINFLKTIFFKHITGSLLFSQSYPFLRWFLMMAIRLVTYFTPLGIFAVFWFWKKIKDFNKLKIVVYAILIQATIHNIVFMEGSFGHPAWSFYFAPIFIIATSLFLQENFQFKKFGFWTFAFIVFVNFNLVFSLTVENWKRKQIKCYIWQYEKIFPLCHQALRKEEEKVLVTDKSEAELVEYYCQLPAVVEKPLEKTGAASKKTNKKADFSFRNFYDFLIKLTGGPQI